MKNLQPCKRCGEPFRVRRGNSSGYCSDLCRFKSRVIQNGDDECWGWIGSRHKFGYGMVHFDGKLDCAHRVSWIVNVGPIPKGQWVLHRCDNPPCSNPRHLFLGTQVENMADAASKGRVPHNERHRMSKLTVDDVIRAREMTSAGKTRVEVAAAIGISRTTISHIITGKTWTRGTALGEFTVPPKPYMRGEQQRAAKLTDEKVREIRRLRSQERPVPFKDLMEMFGVSLPTIEGVVYGRSWKHVI